MKEEIKKILDIADKTYYNWKKQNRPIIGLLDKYFSKEEIEEFLENGSIKKYEEIKIIERDNENILKKFFFEHYSSKSMNIEFSDYIFQEFENHIENIVQNNKEEYPDRAHSFFKTRYITKYNFFEFIINFDIDINRYNFELSKALIIDSISKLNDIEFFIILTRYKEYLEASVFKDKFFLK